MDSPKVVMISTCTHSPVASSLVDMGKQIVRRRDISADAGEDMHDDKQGPSMFEGQTKFWVQR